MFLQFFLILLNKLKYERNNYAYISNNGHNYKDF